MKCGLGNAWDRFGGWSITLGDTWRLCRLAPCGWTQLRVDTKATFTGLPGCEGHGGSVSVLGTCQEHVISHLFYS